MPPATVCESDVQMSALVVRTTASLGPSTGGGLSTMPTLPIPCITNAFTVPPRLTRPVAEGLTQTGSDVQKLSPLAPARGRIDVRPEQGGQVWITSAVQFRGRDPARDSRQHVGDLDAWVGP